MHTAERWPKKDRIAWVEERLRDRIAHRAGYRNDEEVKGIPDQLSLEIWLAKERDELSWQQIVIRCLRKYAKSKQMLAGISRARRAHAAVERALEPTEKQILKNYLDDRIEQVFDCTPQVFKEYLESIRMDKRKK